MLPWPTVPQDRLLPLASFGVCTVREKQLCIIFTHLYRLLRVNFRTSGSNVRSIMGNKISCYHMSALGVKKGTLTFSPVTSTPLQKYLSILGKQDQGWSGFHLLLSHQILATATGKGLDLMDLWYDPV